MHFRPSAHALQISREVALIIFLPKIFQETLAISRLILKRMAHWRTASALLIHWSTEGEKAKEQLIFKSFFHYWGLLEGISGHDNNEDN